MLTIPTHTQTITIAKMKHVELEKLPEERRVKHYGEKDACSVITNHNALFGVAREDSMVLDHERLVIISPRLATISEVKAMARA